MRYWFALVPMYLFAYVPWHMGYQRKDIVLVCGLMGVAWWLLMVTIYELILERNK